MNTMSSVWKHVRRSPYQAAAAILTMFLTFLLGGIFFLTTATSEITLRYFESKPQITVFFSDKTIQSDVDALQKTLLETSKVASTKYVSKDDALAIYREQNKSDPLLLEMVTSDILPASLEITALAPQYLQELEPIIKQSSFVEEVVYQKDVVDSLLGWTQIIRIVGLFLATILGVDSLLIVMTVIGMKIALKRDEVEIMRLVGASPWYIRMPFVVEGGMYGVVGASFAWAIITILVIWFRATIMSFLGDLPLIEMLLGVPWNNIFLASAGIYLAFLALLGFILGSFGSLIAVGRYLKV